MRSPKIRIATFVALLAIASPTMTTSMLTFLFASPALAQASDAQKAEAERLLNVCRRNHQDKQFQLAVTSCSQAVNFYQKIGERYGEAHSLYNLGLAYKNLEQYRKAIDLFQQSLSVATQVGDREVKGLVLMNLRDTYRILQEFDKERNYDQQVLTIIGENSYFRLTGQMPSAGNNPSQEAIAQVSRTKSFADSMLELGSGIRQYNGQPFWVAVSFLLSALDSYEKINDNYGRARALLRLGQAYYLIVEYNKAIDYHQQAHAIFEKIGDSNEKFISRWYLGNVHYAAGNYAESIELYNSALKLHRSAENELEKADFLVDLGNVYLSIGEYSKASDLLQEALSIVRRNRNWNEQIKTLVTLGNVYSSLGEPDKATEIYQQVLSRSKDLAYVFSKEFSDLYNRTVCESSCSIGQIQERNSYFEKTGLPFHYMDDDDLRISLGDVYLAVGQYEKAIELYQGIRQIRDSSVRVSVVDNLLYARAKGNIGNAYLALKMYDKALSSYTDSLESFKKLGSKFGEGNALSNIGITLLSSGNPSAAEESLQNAILIWESLRPGLTDENKVSLFETQAATYRALQQSLVIQKKTEAALEIAERGRARAFVELLAKRFSNQPLSGNAQPPIQPPSIQQIKQIAREQGATLVQYSLINDETLYIWVVKPTGEIGFRPVDLKILKQPSEAIAATKPTAPQRGFGQSSTELIALVNSTRRSLGVVPANSQETGSLTFQSDSTEMGRQLKRLHQLLIDPIADLLPTNPDQSVIFIPQGALFLVPFPALQDANGKFLIEKHTILTAPSIQVLDFTRQQKGRIAGSSGALVVGNPVMPKGLAPLPAAETEAKTIATLFSTQPLLGAQATKATVMQKMPQARVIHLATHGLLDDVRGLGSSIALAPSGNDNGLLTAEEILDMKLNAELVVLSACDTGRGRITGDGVVGLSRSLISAGVPSVLVSLWAVNDDSTALLMTEFYQNLQRQPNKAKALRQAMLTMMKARPNPIDWAAFTLIGEVE